MRQYFRFKRKHPDCLLMFRMGDFYEMFDDDAVAASRALGLTLTERTAGLPMAGMPHHQLEPYVRRIIAQGIRVPVAEQIDTVVNARFGRGMVGVSRRLSDAELAAIISYERYAWGMNSGDTVQSSDIAAAR